MEETRDLDGQDVEGLLQHLKDTRAFDFTAYKRATLVRRIQKRCQAAGASTIEEYQRFLEANPREVQQLFNTILINVTAFFRDDTVWELLRDQVIPDIVETSPPEIRVWSAGCASGEEPYSLAMLFADALGIERYRERVKIYATDVDDDALADARRAVYDERRVAAVPADFRARYFTPEGGNFAVRKDVRRGVIFGRHDLLNDPPISRVSLLTCRNALMYFNSDAQAAILRKFEFGLRPGGYLVVGKAEMILGRGPSLAALDLKRRIFVKGPRSPKVPHKDAMTASNHETHLPDLALDSDPNALLIVTTDGVLRFANARARELFHISTADIGRAFQDHEVSFKPVELRSLIERALGERRASHVKDIDYPATGGALVGLEAHVQPLMSGRQMLGVRIAFLDVTEVRRLQAEVRRSGEELETAYEELQSTNEELETTNEELQSTVEELETTNEELQSTNEELETINEELQSTNEQLNGVNAELRERGDAFKRTNSFLETILRTLNEGVIVVDPELRVLAWNDKAHDMWGLKGDEVEGRHLFNLDFGLPVDRLLQSIKACLHGTERQHEVVPGMNRRGRQIDVEVTCAPVVVDEDGRAGVIILMREPQTA